MNSSAVVMETPEAAAPETDGVLAGDACGHFRTIVASSSRARLPLDEAGPGIEALLALFEI